MVTTISIILIFACLFIIMAIILKKFPALAILNTENIKKEQESKFKDKIIKKRLERDVSKVSGFLGNMFLKINKFFLDTLDKAHVRLKKKKSVYKSFDSLPHSKKEKRIVELTSKAKKNVKDEDFSEAETNLLEVISLDQKNLWAFFELGEVYEELKKYPEARQTYEYSLRLAKQEMKEGLDLGDISLQEIYFSLAFLEKKAGNIEASYDNVLEALEIEPKSPRYLDLILDLSIIKKDKISAEEYLQKLEEVNPDNQKIIEKKKEINQMIED